MGGRRANIGALLLVGGSGLCFRVAVPGEAAASSPPPPRLDDTRNRTSIVAASVVRIGFGGILEYTDKQEPQGRISEAI